MIDQLSRVGKGMILALLMLGFSYKGSYGKIPASFNLSEYLKTPLTYDSKNNQSALKNQLNSLIVKQSGGMAMIVLVGYDSQITPDIRKLTHSQQTPLIFSVSTLPSNSVQFEPENFQFEQNNRTWRPLTKEATVFAIGENSKFGGQLLDDDVQQGVILLPSWFNIKRPIKIKYLHDERIISFRGK